MKLEDISNEEFLKTLKMIFDSDDLEYNEEYLWKLVKDEMKKPRKIRDYCLIHECYLTLSECFGVEYDNKYEKKSNSLINKRKFISYAKAEL